MSLGQFLSMRIFGPLGMKNSQLDPDPKAPGLATGHTAHLLGDAEVAVPEAGGWLHGAGGIYSTANDLAKWDIALMEGKVVPEPFLGQLERHRKLNDGRKRFYSYGLSIAERDGETILSHGGAVSGFHSYNAMVRRTRSAVILLANAEHIDTSGLHRDIVNLLLKDTSAIPRINGPTATEDAKSLVAQLQKGELDRTRFTQEYSHYLNPHRVAKAKERLGELGEPTRFDIEGTSERGGMEVVSFRITFKSKVVKASLYRKPDGTIEQFLLTLP
jgi:CubicO group peptidase (beta-lactamase class C family)